MFLKIRTFLSDDNGPTAVEYAVMLVLIIAVVLGSVIVLGEAAEDSFHNSAQILKTSLDAVLN
jgi:pilus assembly protein Flp/PilA